MGPHDEPPPVTELDIEAAQKLFAGRFDIIEWFGGFLAVPTGVQVTTSTTLGGLVAKLRRLPE